MSIQAVNPAALLSEADALMAKPKFSKEDRSKFDALLAMADPRAGIRPSSPRQARDARA
jgi:hypothetical protein